MPLQLAAADGRTLRDIEQKPGGTRDFGSCLRVRWGRSPDTVQIDVWGLDRGTSVVLYQGIELSGENPDFELPLVPGPYAKVSGSFKLDYGTEANQLLATLTWKCFGLPPGSFDGPLESWFGD
jgi:hypothetical protein